MQARRAAAVVSIGMAAVLGAGVAGAGQQAPVARPGTPTDIAAVVALLKDGEATELQKQQLVGQWYGGTVSVKEVRAVKPGGPAQLIVAVKEESRGNQDNFIEMAFEMLDVERAAKLNKGDRVVLTGQLVRRSIRQTEHMHIGDVEVFEFRHVTLTEP